MVDKTQFESGARKPAPRRPQKVAGKERPHGGIGNAGNDSPRDTKEAPAPNPDGDTGTTEQKPRWEGPPENRPRGYLPSKDDPNSERDAAGENLKDPEKRNLGDAFKKKDD